MKYFYSSVIK